MKLKDDHILNRYSSLVWAVYILSSPVSSKVAIVILIDL
jgi:hypothetical protein